VKWKMRNDEKRNVTWWTLNFVVRIIITLDILNILNILNNLLSINETGLHFPLPGRIFAVLNSVEKPEVRNESRF